MVVESPEERYVLARWMYLMGESIISDPEYDSLEKWYKATYPEDEYSKRSWSFDPCPIELLTKYNLTEYIKDLSLGYFAESIPSVNTQQDFVYRFAGLREKSRLSFKIDGWNTRVTYYNGHITNIGTRGRSGNNLNIPEIRRIFPQYIPIPGKAYVTGELSIPNDLWEMFKSRTGNRDQRASVRTAIANDMCDFLCFRAFNFGSDEKIEGDSYELLSSWGFTTPAFIWVEDYQQLVKGVEYLSGLDKYSDVLTDGLVIENSQYQLAIRLGQWEEHNMISYVTGYEESPGMWGCALNVLIHPIEKEGKRFTKVSIVNIEGITENNLRVGYPIAFNLRSSANVVIDTTATRDLQLRWEGKYEEFQRRINEQRE